MREEQTGKELQALREWLRDARVKEFKSEMEGTNRVLQAIAQIRSTAFGEVLVRLEAELYKEG